MLGIYLLAYPQYKIQKLFRQNINALDLKWGYCQTDLKMGDHNEKLKYLMINSLIAPTVAIAGGAERTPLPTAFMFETGGYAEFTTQTVTTMLQIICLRPQAQCMETYQALAFQ